MDLNEYLVEREKQSKIRRTLRRAGANNCSTEEEVREKLVAYVSRQNRDFHKLGFTDEQLADPEFLMALLKANDGMFGFARLTKEMKADVDFMSEYVQLKHQKDMSTASSESMSNSYLKWTLDRYRDMAANPEFATRLAENFPDAPIITILKDVIASGGYYWPHEKKKEKEDLAKFAKCIKGMPTEILLDQARKFGSSTLKALPEGMPNYSQLVSAGIEKDGFDSVRTLDVTQVLDNKDLVLKAYGKDGFKALNNYITRSLSPHRTYYYMCHGEPHDYSQYEPVYEAVQQGLMEDARIYLIYKQHELLAKAQENIRTTQSQAFNMDLSAEDCMGNV